MAISLPISLTSGFASGLDRFDGMRTRLSSFKSVSDFFDFRRISKPNGFGDFQTRVMFNIGYFSTNYALLIAMLSVYSLLTNLLLLFVMILAGVGVYGISRLGDRDLDLGFTKLTVGQLYAGLAVISVPLFILASPFSTLLWLVGASIVVVGVHAALMEKPIESSFQGTV